MWDIVLVSQNTVLFIQYLLITKKWIKISLNYLNMLIWQRDRDNICNYGGYNKLNIIINIVSRVICIPAEQVASVPLQLPSP